MPNKPGMTPAALSALADGDLVNAALAMQPGGIEAQEKAGQTVFVQAETMPTKGLEPRDRLVAAGFVIGEPADSLFTHVKLPPGWKKIATDHSMWSDLVDDKGRKRAGIFYKAAFYDRAAHIHWDSAVQVLVRTADGRPTYEPKEDEPVDLVGIVEHSGKEVFRTPAVSCVGQNSWGTESKLNAQARKWADEHYPNHTDPFAYWE